MASPNPTVRTELARHVRLMLGEGMIDLEIDPEHVDLAITMAFDRYRQRSSNSVEESYVFLDLQPDQQDYVLPTEIKAVKEVHRRGVAGLATGGGSYLEPFSLAYTNLYLLQAGDMGSLALYDFYCQYQETVGRLFGQNINFKFDVSTNTLTIMRKIIHTENVLLSVYTERPEHNIWSDPFSKPWIRDYTLAQTKRMIAEARGLFGGGLPGPQGGVTMNSEQLRADAQADIERLELEIQNYVTGEDPPYFVIG